MRKCGRPGADACYQIRIRQVRYRITAVDYNYVEREREREREREETLEVRDLFKKRKQIPQQKIEVWRLY